jgi:hypothetical protein
VDQVGEELQASLRFGGVKEDRVLLVIEDVAAPRTDQAMPYSLARLRTLP